MSPDEATGGEQPSTAPTDEASERAAPIESIDLERASGVSIGITHGELALDIGTSGNEATRADVSVRPEDTDRLLLTVDAMAGDHGVGHADVELTLEEARALGEVLLETVRWMAAP